MSRKLRSWNPPRTPALKYGYSKSAGLYLRSRVVYPGEAPSEPILDGTFYYEAGRALQPVFWAAILLLPLFAQAIGRTIAHWILIPLLNHFELWPAFFYWLEITRWKTQT